MIEKFRKEEKKLKKPKNKNQEFLFMYKYEHFQNLQLSKTIFTPINYIYHKKIK